MKKILIIVLALFVCAPALAARVGFHVGTGGIGFGYRGHNTDVYVGTPYYAPAPYGYRYGYNEYVAPYRVYLHGGGGYYPNWNPVERRDIQYREDVDRRGNVHSESTVEDRHSSYYSPGRNEAITPPQRRVGRDWRGNEIDRTTWIGADGQPHSTTIRRNTQVDPWGNTHTDTHVDLKKKPGEEVAEDQKPSKLMPTVKKPKVEVENPEK